MSALSSIDDFKYRFQSPGFSSYGTAGIIQMPSSRFMPEGSAGIVYSSFEPYKRLSMIAYPFPWLETLYHYTDIENKLYSDVFAFSGNQTYKDKGFDIKIKLTKEKRFLPSISVGFRDLAGTGIFSSEYIVASKLYNNIDFTAGIGWGILNQNGIKNPMIRIDQSFKSRQNFEGKGGEISTGSFFSGDQIGVFGAIEYLVPFRQGLRLKAEYDSTDYENEGFLPVIQKSKFNLGITYALNRDTKINFSYIRGNTFQFGLSYVINFGRKEPLVKKTNHYKTIPNSNIVKKVTARDSSYLYRAALKYMSDNDLYIRTATITEDNSKLNISYATNKFLSYPRAYGRLVRTLDDLAPENITDFSITPINLDYELANIQINRAAFNKYKLNKDYKSLSDKTIISQDFQSISDHQFKPSTNLPKSFYEFGPSIQSHIGGPDRFIIGGINLEGNIETLLRRDLTIQTKFRIGITDTFDTLQQPSDSILPHVRSDVIDYLKEGKKFSITRLQANYFGNPYKSFYTKLSVGIFEEMFGGYGGEVLYRPFFLNWAFGIEAYHAEQRAYNQRLRFLNYKIKTGHATAYYQHPETQILFKLSGGRYLAGDSGFTFDASRKFRSGVRVGAFFTLTDISKEEFGEGSFDKGFYFDFPLKILFTDYRRDLSSFGLRPLTRDGGAKLIVGHDLFGITDQGSFTNININFDDIYD